MIGRPRLLGSYRMGFEIVYQANAGRLSGWAIAGMMLIVIALFYVVREQVGASSQ